MAAPVVLRFLGDKGRLESDVRSLEKRMDNFGRSMQRVGTVLTAAVTVPLVAFAKSAIDSAEELSTVRSISEQVIKQTGGVANVTAGAVSKLTKSLERKTAVDDKVIQAGSNVLLTFRNIANEAGDGNAIFDRTNAIMLDLAAVTGTDVTSAATQLGKALDNPVKGVTALQRVGVSFTDQQRDQIAAMVESGDTLGAQKLILDELETQYGGTAAASKNATDVIRTGWENVKERLGTALLPVVETISERITQWADRVERLSDSQVRLIVKIGGVAAAIGPALIVVGSLVRLFSRIGFLLSPAGLIIGGLVLLAGAFGTAMARSDEFRTLIRDELAPKFGELAEAIREGALRALEAFVQWFLDNEDTIIGVATAITDGLTDFFAFFSDEAKTATRAMDAAFGEGGEIPTAWGVTAEAAKTTFGEGGEIPEAFAGFRRRSRAETATVQELWTILGDDAESLGTRVASAWELMNRDVNDIIEAMFGEGVANWGKGQDGIIHEAGIFFGNIVEGWKGLFADVMGQAQAFWQSITRVFGFIFSDLRKIVGDWIRDRLEDFGRFIADVGRRWAIAKVVWKILVGKAMNAIRDLVKEKVDAIVGFFRDLPGRAADALVNLGPRLKTAITDALKGIKIELPFGLSFGGDGFGIPGTGGGGLMGISPTSAVGAAYSSLGRPGDVISGFRQGSRTRSGNLSYHALARALDITPIRTIAGAIRAFFGSRTRELITPWQGMDLLNGRPHRYSDAVKADHDGRTNVRHIHWAMEHGAAFTRPTTLQGPIDIAERHPEVVAPEPMLRDIIRSELGRVGPIHIHTHIGTKEVAHEIVDPLRGELRRRGLRAFP